MSSASAVHDVAWRICDWIGIDEKTIPVREIFDGYVDSAELGVRGFHDKHDIRPLLCDFWAARWYNMRQ